MISKCLDSLIDLVCLLNMQHVFCVFVTGKFESRLTKQLSQGDDKQILWKVEIPPPKSAKDQKPKEIQIRLRKTGKTLDSYVKEIEAKRISLVEKLMDYRNSPYFQDFDLWQNLAKTFDLESFPAEKSEIKTFRSKR